MNNLMLFVCALQERDAVLGSLARRAATLVAGLNQLEGVSCNAAEGALYAFPRCADSPHRRSWDIRCVSRREVFSNAAG